MLAEIFMLRLEAVVRMAAKEAAANSRFVPITLPTARPLGDTHPQAVVPDAPAREPTPFA
jgi:hypothetical protein